MATADQNQTAAGNLHVQVALDGGAYATVSIAGADWSGAGGAAALQAAMQTAVDTAIGAGNATATVTGGNGSRSSISLAPAGSHQLLVQAASGNNGFATLLGTTAVGLDGVGGRQFFTGSDAASLAVSSDVAGNANAIAAGLAGNGPLDGSRALDLADLAAIADRPGCDLSPDDRATRGRHGRPRRTATRSSRRPPERSTTHARRLVGRQQRRGDDEPRQFQHAYEAAARFLTTIDSMLDTLDQPHRTDGAEAGGTTDAVVRLPHLRTRCWSTTR